MDELINSYNIKLIPNYYNNNSVINRHVCKIYIINLFTNKVRREYIKILMNKLKINYVLVLVNKPSFDICNKVNKLSKNKAKMSRGEVGCYLSHMWCLNDIIQNNYKNAIIFEDDIIVHKDLDNLYKNIITKKHWDFLILGCADAGFKEVNYNLVKDNIYIPKHKFIIGTHSIYYSLHGAKTMFNLRKNNPVYFDKDLKNVFNLFDQYKSGIIYPNLFTIENSTTNLNHNFGISKFEDNNYYYNKFYKNFNFNDYHFIYLDLFNKYILESKYKLLKESPRNIIKKLLNNYFNNNELLIDLHYKRLDLDFFSSDDLINILSKAYDFKYDKYYADYKNILCKKHNVTSGILIKNNIPRKKEKISKLFYKQELDKTIVDKKIQYKTISIGKKDKNYLAHLHCFDISDFENIYGKYLDKIKKNFDIIVTFSKYPSNLDKKIKYMLFGCTVLSCENKGMDIGAKFIVMNFIKIKRNYKYILFLHSKSCEYTRSIYFDNLINNILNQDLDSELIGGYFPPTIITGLDTSIIYDDYVSKKSLIKNKLYLPHKANKFYIDEFIKFFNLPSKDITIWPSGNCYCLHYDIAEKLFSDIKIYNSLSYPIYNNNNQAVECFDYNWVKNYYELPFNDIEFIYEISKKLKYKMNFLQITDELEKKNYKIRDGMIEHSFERLVFSLIFNTKNKFGNFYNIKILCNKENKNSNQIEDISNYINECYNTRLLYENFDYEKYLQKYDDLVKNNVKTKDQAWKHWSFHGWNENRFF